MCSRRPDPVAVARSKSSIQVQVDTHNHRPSPPRRRSLPPSRRFAARRPARLLPSCPAADLPPLSRRCPPLPLASPRRPAADRCRHPACLPPLSLASPGCPAADPVEWRRACAPPTETTVAEPSVEGPAKPDRSPVVRDGACLDVPPADGVSPAVQPKVHRAPD